MTDAQRLSDVEDSLKAIAGQARGSVQTMEDLASDFVREAILQGLFRPGQRLQQDYIAELLGMSRMPVRAGIRKLENEGLVVFHRYRGATVRLLTSADIAEIYQMRILIETHLIELAAQHLTPEVLIELQESSDHVHSASQETRDWIELRRDFYRKLYSLAERPRMAELVNELRREVGPYLVMRDAMSSESSHFHLSVLQYLQAGDVDGATEALSKHLAEVSIQLQDLVDGFGSKGPDGAGAA
jgi:DNA-binding GntR family transcriptional regulator